MRTRVPVGRRHHAAKAPRFKLTRIDKRLNETPWDIVSAIVIMPWRELDRFGRFAPWLWPIAVIYAAIEPSAMHAL
jgi:hypothetical protein